MQAIKSALSEKKALIKFLLFITLVILVGIVAFSKYGPSAYNEEEYKECAKAYTSFTGAEYTYKVKTDLDCSKYTDKLIEEYGRNL